MALHADLYPDFSPLVLWLRLPLQAVLIAWAYWFTRPEPAFQPAASPTSLRP
jgi:uncharacterized membrane protein